MQRSGSIPFIKFGRSVRFNQDAILALIVEKTIG